MNDQKRWVINTKQGYITGSLENLYFVNNPINARKFSFEEVEFDENSFKSDEIIKIVNLYKDATLEIL